jgi:hypothetical protein
MQWVPGTLSQGAKRQGREANHSPPTSAEVKKSEAILPLPHKFTFLLLKFTFLLLLLLNTNCPQN